ncbi:MAG TPA: hypothetical protein VJZ27_11185, partial [Aggregatilineales bacterium]|nr:hypothetical protein [Aggregatilineales bacterium]
MQTLDTTLRSGIENNILTFEPDPNDMSDAIVSIFDTYLPDGKLSVKLDAGSPAWNEAAKTISIEGKYVYVPEVDETEIGLSFDTLKVRAEFAEKVLQTSDPETTELVFTLTIKNPLDANAGSLFGFLNELPVDDPRLVLSSHHVLNNGNVVAPDEDFGSSDLLESHALMKLAAGCNIIGILKLSGSLQALATLLDTVELFDLRASVDNFMADEGTITLAARHDKPINLRLFSLPYAEVRIGFAFNRKDDRQIKIQNVELQTEMVSGTIKIPVLATLEIDEETLTIELLPDDALSAAAQELTNLNFEAGELANYLPAESHPRDFAGLLTLLSPSTAMLPEGIELAST